MDVKAIMVEDHNKDERVVLSTATDPIDAIKTFLNQVHCFDKSKLDEVEVIIDEVVRDDKQAWKCLGVTGTCKECEVII